MANIPQIDPLTDPGVAVLTEQQAAKYLSLSLIQLKRMRERGKAPKIVRLSERRLGYRKATLDAWLAEREE